MPVSIRRATPFVALTLLLAACGPQAQATPQSTIAPTAAPTTAPTAAPTALPEPTAVPLLAKDVTIGGVDVGGLDVEAARAKLENGLSSAIVPLELHTGAISVTLEPEQIGLVPDIDGMLVAAEQAGEGDELPLALTYDEAKLRAQLESAAEQVNSAGGGLDVIRDTELISASFVLGTSAQLDVDTALAQVEEHLKTPEYTEPLTLELTLGEAGSARPTQEQLQAELEKMAEEFDGVVGVYIHDLKSDKELASINKGTAFSTASTIKVAIMLNAYAHVEKFNAKQQKALEKMIIESDNLKANDVLAASVGGVATEQAFEGAQLMSDMLAELGMPTTYQYTPFEANDFIKLYKPKYTVGPKQAGEAPFTNSSRVQRTTPYEMAQIYRLIEQCTRGEGALVEKFPETLSAERCEEMVALLKKNADHKRMMSGLPDDLVVAHKSGWAQPEVQGDAGIVQTPGGDFIISVYVYQKGEKYKDSFVQRLIGNFTRLAYTYYNPLPVASEQ